METFIGITSIAVMLVVVCYANLVTTGYDNFRGITLQLDEMYTNTNEMACVVFEELKKQGRECEITEMGKGYPKFSIEGFPVQTVQLKICKE